MEQIAGYGILRAYRQSQSQQKQQDGYRNLVAECFQRFYVFAYATNGYASEKQGQYDYHKINGF
jgi:hypothetical protein